MDGGLKEKKMNINIEIKGQQAHIVNQQSLISGTSNLEEIKFDFSSEVGFSGKNVNFTLEFLVTIQKVEELLQQLYVRK